jgi:hypothetical protein
MSMQMRRTDSTDLHIVVDVGFNVLPHGIDALCLSNCIPSRILYKMNMS